MQSLKTRLLHVFGSFLFAIALLFASVLLPVKSSSLDYQDLLEQSEIEKKELAQSDELNRSDKKETDTGP